MASIHPASSVSSRASVPGAWLLVASPESRLWKCSILVALGLFLLPYTTGALAWGYANGLFPIRPALYMLGVGLVCLMLTLTRRPDFTLLFGLVFAFLTVRFADGAILQRFSHPEGASYVFFSIGATMFSVLVLASAIGVLHRTSLQPLSLIAAVSVLISSLAIFAEWRGIGSFSNVQGRPSGFSGDPNNASISIVTMLGVFLTLEKRFWFQVSLIAVASAAVALSLSRSGVFVLAVLLLAYLVINFRAHHRRFLLCALATIPIGFAAVALVVSDTSPEIAATANSNDRARAIFEGDVARMGSSERMKDLRDGIAAVARRPIAGYGLGAGTRKWMPHNQLVSTWIDVGILGAGLLLLILALLLINSLASRGAGLLCVIPVILFVPFSQILADSAVFWCAALLAAVLTSRRFWSFRIFADRQPSESTGSHRNQQRTPSTHG